MGSRREPEYELLVMLTWYGASFKTVCWRKQRVCSKTKGWQRHNVTWWLNNDVANSIKEKQHLFKIYITINLGRVIQIGQGSNKMKESIKI